MLSQELIARLRERAADPKTRTDGVEALQYAEQPAGLETTHLEVRWGEIWSELRPVPAA